MLAHLKHKISRNSPASGNMTICFSSGIWVLVLSTIVISWTTSFVRYVLFKNCSLNSFSADAISSVVLFSSVRFFFSRTCLHMLIATAEIGMPRFSSLILSRYAAIRGLRSWSKMSKKWNIFLEITWVRGRDKRWRGEDHQFRWLHKRPLKKKNIWHRYKKKQMRSPKKHQQFRFQTFTTLVLVGLCKKVHKSWFKFTSWFRGGRGFDFGWMLIKTFLISNLKLEIDIYTYWEPKAK